MSGMEDQLFRIDAKLRSRRLTLNPVASEAEVRDFELRHGITLPGEYRAFITRLGNGGAGPPTYGLDRLGHPSSDMRPEQRIFWTELTRVREPFPFTRHWVWEEGEASREGTHDDVYRGSIYLGNEGCGMYWHLIITGEDRGIPWMLCGEGIQPVCPERTFLQWYEDWLDGRDSFYGFPEQRSPSVH